MDERKQLIKWIQSYNGPGWRTLSRPKFKDEPTPAEQLANYLLAAGYVRIPAADSVEGDAMVERIAAIYWREIYGKHRPGKDRWPEDVVGQSQDIFRNITRIHLAALRAETEVP